VLTADRNPGNNYGEFARLIFATVESLEHQHLKVTIVASVPEIGVHVPNVLAREAAEGMAPLLQTPRANFTARQRRVLHLFSELSEKYAVKLVFPDQTLCNGVSCPTMRDDHVLYVDDSHLSIHGAMDLAPVFTPLLRTAF